MSRYYISGIWKANGVVTHYAVHAPEENSWTRATKTTKANAVALIEQNGITAYTRMWNYRLASWTHGEEILVVSVNGVKHLRSHADGKPTDNLDNLINADWYIA